MRRMQCHNIRKSSIGESFGLGGLDIGYQYRSNFLAHGLLLPLLKYYFLSEVLSESDTSYRSTFRSKWYGNLDGSHLHKAISEPIQELPESWEVFRQRATLLKCVHSIER